ncbi:MAG TPA: hydantoinase/oxoprolinase family protein [Terriglobales bacterium]|nr:hydantoinase/oxoprolinase family protein [Terriglobales bacterium]
MSRQNGLPPRPGGGPARIAIDTGGTFTDCVYLADGRLQVLKLFSTPQDAGQAIHHALAQIGPAPGAEIRHGTTVGTNTLLERTGARVAFVTTAGFEDTIAIGRQARPRLYQWSNPAPTPLAPPALRFGVDERTLPDGAILRPASAAGLRALFQRMAAAQPEAVAVSLLFSFANPKNERAVVRALEELGVPVSASHQILPEFREYERGATVLINAYLAPKMGSYLLRLQARLAQAYPGARLHVMQSSGGIVSAPVAAREPVRTILSGPAGGVVGAHRLARLAGCERILTFDMGGTSTDVALVDGHSHGGHLRTTNEAQVMGLPVGVPMLDIHTVGAGGGSLASFDGGGALRVGPESAGAEPGPICYGRGERPTVTDANLLLGRLDPDAFLGGGLRLDTERARRLFARAKGPLASVEVFADGIVRLAEATMEKALRMISVERGFDPREFTLVSFGGAGPLHACALAAGLEIPRVLVPQMPGALSALGILMSDMVKDYSRTVMEPVPAGGPAAPLRARLEAHFRALEARGRREMRAEGLDGVGLRSLDLRYAGQGYELNLEWAAGHDFADRFHQLHQRRYGYADPQRPLEVVNARLRLVAASAPLAFPRLRLRPGDARHALAAQRRVWFDGRFRRAPVYARERLRPGDRFAGPALVTEYSATTVVPPGWRTHVDAWQNLHLERTARP